MPRKDPGGRTAAAPSRASSRELRGAVKARPWFGPLLCPPSPPAPHTQAPFRESHLASYTPSQCPARRDADRLLQAGTPTLHSPPSCSRVRVLPGPSFAPESEPRASSVLGRGCPGFLSSARNTSRRQAFTWRSRFPRRDSLPRSWLRSTRTDPSTTQAPGGRAGPPTASPRHPAPPSRRWLAIDSARHLSLHGHTRGPQRAGVRSIPWPQQLGRPSAPRGASEPFSAPHPPPR